MACYFRGFHFVRNFFILSVIRRAFGNQKEEKIYLPWLFVVFAALTLNAVPSGASPPTHYVSVFRVSEYSYGLSPDVAAQGYVVLYNSVAEGGRAEITGSCRVVPVTGGGYMCPFSKWGPLGDFWGNADIAVYTRCGPQAAAEWNGSEFYCPPEPDCDTPVR